MVSHQQCRMSPQESCDLGILKPRDEDAQLGILPLPISCTGIDIDGVEQIRAVVDVTAMHDALKGIPGRVA